MSPSRKRAAAADLQQKFSVSERRACQALEQPRSTQRYEPKPRGDELALAKGMLKVARRRPRWGYRRVAWRLRRDGWRASDTRVYRLWRREGLKVPVKKRKKRRLGKSENGCVHRRAEHRDHVWCWDFVFDHTTSGSQLKWLSIVDEYTRECLALKVARSITSEDVIDTLAELFGMRGVPKCLRSDNGPEFIAPSSVRALAGSGGCRDAVHRAGKSVGERLRRELPQPAPGRVLGVGGVSGGLSSCQAADPAVAENCNHHRPHSSLGYVTPNEFAARCATSVRATPSLQQHSGRLPNPTFIAPRTKNQSWSITLAAKAEEDMARHLR